jgi:hypothetical protein
VACFTAAIADGDPRPSGINAISVNAVTAAAMANRRSIPRRLEVLSAIPLPPEIGFRMLAT